MKKIKTNKGLTLIEIIISIAILAILAVALLGLFNNAFLWIYSAGDRGTAFSDAQFDLEERLALGEASNASNLQINFSGLDDPIEVVGEELTSTSEMYGRQETTFDAFAPFVPIISVDPAVISEASSLPLITIEGKNTNFQSGNTTLNILDRWGNIAPHQDFTVTDSTTASFRLLSGTTNMRSPYIVRVSTNLSGAPTEIARTKLLISQPRYVIAGDEVYVARDDSFFMNRGEIDVFPSFNEIYGATYGFGRYILVGSGGRVLVSNDQQSWSEYTIAGGTDLHDVTWSAQRSLYFVAADDGRVFSSSNGAVWSEVDTLTHNDEEVSLRGITAGLDRKLVAVGSTEDGIGVIFTSNTGDFWSETEDTGHPLHGATFHVKNDIDSTHNFVVVGENGLILTSSDASSGSWTVRNTSADTIFRGVAYNDGTLMAVGDGTSAYSEDDGVNWFVATSLGHDLYSVFGRNGEFHAVGDAGVIIRSSDGTNSWSIKLGSVPNDVNLRVITGR